MTETLEHLERSAGIRTLRTVRAAAVNKLILSTPNNSMPPEEIAEHTALFNEELVRDMLQEAGYTEDAWNISFSFPYKTHLVCVVSRK